MQNSNNQNNNNNGGQASQQHQPPQHPVNQNTQGTWSNQQDPFSYDIFKGNEPKNNKNK